MWKPKYAANRRRKAKEDPEYRARRNEQGRPKDPEARKQYNREWVKRNKERLAAYRRATAEERNRRQRERYAADKEFREQRKRETREWQRRNPDAKRDRRFQVTYGITLDDYRRMLAEQGGACAICGVKGRADRANRRLHVDHCHDTGRVRGLLCSACNFGIGKFKDDPELLKRAAAYLRADSPE